ncbi:MAG: SMC-Scp complex subunit ScpB [Nitrospira sp.]|nr:SMC-Scp complex subunit ScpB [Nitrospira sp.]
MTPVTEELTQVMPEADPVIAGPQQETEEPSNGEQAAPTADATQAIAERELKAILESLLFVSPEPLSAVRLVAVLGDVTKAEVERTLKSLGKDLDQDGRGIRLVEVAGGYRLVTKQEYASWIKRLDKAKSAAKLSRSALESLAIIAYKQPLVRSEIEEIRGVETSGVVRTLLERKLVRIVGRKEVPGRPIMYGTTKFFLEHFGLNDLSQLPPLREFKELGEAEQALLPMDDALSITVDAPVGDDRAKSIEGVCQESLSLNGEESPVEFNADEDKVDEELKGHEELAGEPVEQV